MLGLASPSIKGSPLLWDLTKPPCPPKPAQTSKISVKTNSINRTTEHDTTRPITSILASARAVLAAIIPAATQPSIPSVSITVRKISMVAFGSDSSRTEVRMAWWIAIPIDLSSASCFNVWDDSISELNDIRAWELFFDYTSTVQTLLRHSNAPFHGMQ